MPSESVVLIANICQASVPIIVLLAYVPQWQRLWRTDEPRLAAAVAFPPLSLPHAAQTSAHESQPGG